MKKINHQIRIIYLAIVMLLVFGPIDILAQFNVYYSEDFEIPTSTYNFTSLATGSPPWTLHSGLAHSGSYCAKAQCSGLGSDFYLELPPLNCTSYSNVFLSFYHINKELFYDQGTFEYSYDGGSVWWPIDTTTIADWDHYGALLFWSQGYRFQEGNYVEWQPMVSIPPSNSWWKKEIFDLSPIASGKADFRIRFKLYDANLTWYTPYPVHGWFIDDIVISSAVCGLNFPTVTNTLTPDVSIPGPYPIEVDAYDDDGIQQVLLYYSFDNGLTYNQVNMIPPVDPNGNGIYSYIFPSMSGNISIMYYTIVTDNSICQEIITGETFAGSYIIPSLSHCDDPTYPLDINTDCMHPLPICGPKYVNHNFVPGASIPVLYYSFYVPVDPTGVGVAPPIITTPDPTGMYNFQICRLYKLECGMSTESVCDITPPLPSSFYADAVNGNFGLSPLDEGFLYVLAIQPNEFSGCFDILWRYGQPILCYCPQEPCINCIASFAPDDGKEYVLSAWVKESGASPLSTTKYDDPEISIAFGTGPAAYTFTAKGLIIDGWQRIEEKFFIPLNTVEITVLLSALNKDSYFDDIRIYPVDGSMKSYVYNPDTKLFVAELDENNYATFYEYDEDGKLTRVKKETERGIMTIKEHRNNNSRR